MEVERGAARAYRMNKKIPDLNADLNTRSSPPAKASTWSGWAKSLLLGPPASAAPIPGWLMRPSEHELAWINFGIYKVCALWGGEPSLSLEHCLCWDNLSSSESRLKDVGKPSETPSDYAAFQMDFRLNKAVVLGSDPSTPYTRSDRFIFLMIKYSW